MHRSISVATVFAAAVNVTLFICNFVQPFLRGVDPETGHCHGTRGHFISHLLIPIGGFLGYFSFGLGVAMVIKTRREIDVNFSIVPSKKQTAKTIQRSIDDTSRFNQTLDISEQATEIPKLPQRQLSMVWRRRKSSNTLLWMAVANIAFSSISLLCVTLERRLGILGFQALTVISITDTLLTILCSSLIVRRITNRRKLQRPSSRRRPQNKTARNTSPGRKNVST